MEWWQARGAKEASIRPPQHLLTALNTAHKFNREQKKESLQEEDEDEGDTIWKDVLEDIDSPCVNKLYKTPRKRKKIPSVAPNKANASGIQVSAPS